jgi:hypothetical protein
MFNKRSKDGGLIYSDKNMADFFGWELSTVALRREEYDLNGQEELEKLVFSDVTKQPETYDVLKQQRDRLQSKHEKEINKLKEKIDSLSNQLVGEHDLVQKVLDLEKAFEQLS